MRRTYAYSAAGIGIGAGFLLGAQTGSLLGMILSAAVGGAIGYFGIRLVESGVDKGVDMASNAIKGKIDDVRKKSATAKAEKIYCPNCGEENPVGNQSCKACGHALLSNGTGRTISQKNVTQNSVVCPNCGSAISPGSSFCPNCGMPYVSADNEKAVGQASTTPDFHICPQCGEKNAGAAMFCKNCGSQLKR